MQSSFADCSFASPTPQSPSVNMRPSMCGENDSARSRRAAERWLACYVQVETLVLHAFASGCASAYHHEQPGLARARRGDEDRWA